MTDRLFTPAELETLRQAAAEEYAQIAEDLTCRFCKTTPVRAPGDGCGACLEALLQDVAVLEAELHELKRCGDA